MRPTQYWDVRQRYGKRRTVRPWQLRAVRALLGTYPIDVRKMPPNWRKLARWHMPGKDREFLRRMRHWRKGVRLEDDEYIGELTSDGVRLFDAR